MMKLLLNCSIWHWSISARNGRCLSSNLPPLTQNL